MFGTDSPQAVRLSGQAVFLLAASPDVGSALKTVCPANAARLERGGPRRTRAVWRTRRHIQRFGERRAGAASRKPAMDLDSLPDHEHVSRLRCIDE